MRRLISGVRIGLKFQRLMVEIKGILILKIKRLWLNDLQAKIVSFYGRKFSFTATRQRSGKTGICDRKMIQFMPANHSNKSRYHITITIMNILMKWSYNETFVFIFLLRWHFHPTYVFLNMLYFYIWTKLNVNTKELMQFQYDTDTSTTVNNYGLLEMKGETRWLGMSLFTCGLSEHAMNASDTENVIGNRCTK